MNSANRILAIGLSLCLVLLIFELVRRRRLKEKYALLWILSGCVIFVLAVSDKILDWITKLIGIMLPINTLFFFGIFFIILINLHFSLVISNLSEQNKKIVQKLALLDIEIKNLKEKKVSCNTQN